MKSLPPIEPPHPDDDWEEAEVEAARRSALEYRQDQRFRDLVLWAALAFGLLLLCVLLEQFGT